MVKYFYLIALLLATTFLYTQIEIKKNSASNPSEYEVFESETSPYFILLSSIENNRPFYIGEKSKIIYKIMHKRNIDIVRKHLPLLMNSYFEYINDANIENYFQNGFIIQEIVQEIKMSHPGEYQFEPSFVEGYVCTTNAFNEKKHIQPRLRAESATPKIVVREFPIANKPENFSGNIGDYDIKTTLVNNSEIYLGDEIILEIAITSPDDISAIEMPKLYLNPDFENFIISGSSFSTEKDQKCKIFTITMRPISSTIKYIPAIDFNYFNPQKNEYFNKKSDIIPISVLNKDDILISSQIDSTTFEDIHTVMPLKNHFISNSEKSLIFLILISATLILAELFLITFLKHQKNKLFKRNSSFYFKLALKQTEQRAIFFANIEKACLYKLYEKKIIDTPHLKSFKDIPVNKNSEKTIIFLEDCEHQLFNMSGMLDIDTIILAAKKILS